MVSSALRVRIPKSNGQGIVEIWTVIREFLPTQTLHLTLHLLPRTDYQQSHPVSVSGLE